MSKNETHAQSETLHSCKGTRTQKNKAKECAPKTLLRDTLEKLLGSTSDGITLQEAIAISIVEKAMGGDIRAAEFIRDTVGQKPEHLNKAEAVGGLDMATLIDKGKRVANITK